jgi:hypothetical protein
MGDIRMLSRIPKLRTSVPLALAVFVVGAGIGAALIVLADNSPHKQIVVQRLVTDAPTSLSESSTTTSTSTVTVRLSSHLPVPVQATRAPHQKPRVKSILPPGAASSFSAMAAGLHGQVGLAVAPLGAGTVHVFGSVRIAHAWSTSKVPVLVTLLHDYEGSGQRLSPSENDDATLALEQSDNAAIEALFGVLEQIHGGLVPASAAVQARLRAAGDETTIINTAPNGEGFTTYGQSEWSLPGEVTFYRALARGCLLGQADTSYVLGLMRNVVSYQRWGAGSAGYPPEVSLAFKGGWGPDSAGNYQVRQTAIVGSGGRGYVMAMIALPASGSFDDGTQMLTALATWARQNLDPDAPRPSAGCRPTT